MLLKRFVIAAVLALALGAPACAGNMPLNLNPQATIAYQNKQIVGVLDLIRDVAIDANDQDPPLLDTDTTRKVVLYHQSALRILDSRVNGWQEALAIGINEVVRNLPNAQRQLMSPYVALLQSLIREVQ